LRENGPVTVETPCPSPEDRRTTPMVPDLVCGNDGIDGWQCARCAQWEHGTALLRRDTLLSRVAMFVVAPRRNKIK